MAITPLQEFVSAVLTRQSSANTSRVAGLAPVSALSATNADSAASVLDVSGAPSGSFDLHSASVSLAQLSALLQVAQGGIDQAQGVLQNLQALAAQAASNGPQSDLVPLNSEFQQVLAQLNAIASDTHFGNAALLDGSLSDSGGAAQDTNTLSLSLPDVSVQGFFGANPPTLQDPNATLALIANAQNVLQAAGASAADTQGQVSQAVASVDTALANGIAAASLLTTSDLTGGDTSLVGLQNTPAASASVQTENLPASLLSLLQA
jgi:flagellin